MVSNSKVVEEEFIEAKNNWNLDKLYIDLASSKGKALTPVERKFLRGLLCGLSPAEIAHIVYKTRSSSTVRVYLSNGLYKYLEEMLSIQAGKSVKVKNWSHVTHLLEKAGYKKTGQPRENLPDVVTVTSPLQTDSMIELPIQQDWGGAIDVKVFHGRAAEIAVITDWILEQQCRLLLIAGMGGIGKTALSVKVAQQVQEEFDYVIWRSLSQFTSLEELLTQLIDILLPEEELSPLTNLAALTAKLLGCLHSCRCLLILDGWESVLDSNADGDGDSQIATYMKNVTGNSEYIPAALNYRPGYEVYGEFLQVLGNSPHQSCVILTSREKPPEIDALPAEQMPICYLQLKGLTNVESQKLFSQKGLSNISKKDYQILLDVYGGNPLFIQFVATTIQELFGGSIDEFLAQETFVFGNIRRIIEQQWQRLSGLEKQIISWLALQENSASLPNIQAGMSSSIPRRLILEAVELLHKRSLIQGQASSLSLTPILTEYITENLIEENLQFWANKPAYMHLKHKSFAREMKSNIRKKYRSAK